MLFPEINTINVLREQLNASGFGAAAKSMLAKAGFDLDSIVTPTGEAVAVIPASAEHDDTPASSGVGTADS